MNFLGKKATLMLLKVVSFSALALLLANLFTGVDWLEAVGNVGRGGIGLTACIILLFHAMNMDSKKT